MVSLFCFIGILYIFTNMFFNFMYYETSYTEFNKKR